MQAAFDFTAPFTGSSPRTRHSSHQGALKAEERIGRQMVTLLTIYRLGDWTDAEMAERSGLMRTSVIPRRRSLMQRGFVEEKGHRRNEQTGVSNTVFGLAR
jgi:hypothetical protein